MPMDGSNRRRPPTPKQQAFAREYLVDMNATKAAIRAGYSARTAKHIGSENLTKPAVQALVEQGMRARSVRTEIDGDRVLKELAYIAFADIGEVFTEDGSLRPLKDISEAARRALAGIETDELLGAGAERVKVGVTRKVRHLDKIRALELLGKHLKLWTDVIEAKVEGLDDGQRAARVQALLERARARKAGG